MIQSIMLAAMGFIAASLLALLIAPAFWARAVRLTNQRLRSALPVSEQEIRADKDLLRAEFALKVHQLEREVDQGQLAAHRQQIEINRRDIEIRRLAESLGISETSLGEHRNARSVLEQTVTERIPALESSLAQARSLLQARDSAIDELQSTADRQAAALEDGRAILTQRALEVQRLQALFQEASAQGRDLRNEAGSDNMALRAEIESLKARLAERAAVIDRLQGEVAARPRTAASTALLFGVPQDASPTQLRAFILEQSSEIAQLRSDLEARPRDAAPSLLPPAERDISARQFKDLEAKLRAQTDELAGLRAENEAIAQAGDPAANARIRESKVWLRSKIDRLNSDIGHERETTGRLRAELAAANDRAARQSAQLRDELRRQPTRIAIPARDVLRDAAKSSVEVAPKIEPQAEAEAAPRRQSISQRARELQRALAGQFGQNGQPASQNASPEGVPASQTTVAVTTAAAEPAADAAALPNPANDIAGADPAQRGRLLDRLKSYEQV